MLALLVLLNLEVETLGPGTSCKLVKLVRARGPHWAWGSRGRWRVGWESSQQVFLFGIPSLARLQEEVAVAVLLSAKLASLSGKSSLFLGLLCHVSSQAPLPETLLPTSSTAASNHEANCAFYGHNLPNLVILISNHQHCHILQSYAMRKRLQTSHCI